MNINEKQIKTTNFEIQNEYTEMADEPSENGYHLQF